MRIPASSIVDVHTLNRLQRGRRYSTVGWLTAAGSLALALSSALSLVTTPIAGRLTLIGLTASIALINSTRLWVKESREPFRFTYSVGSFEGSLDDSGGSKTEAGDQMSWLSRDLAEKLGERVKRLSLRPESAVGAASTDEIPSHVHISGWYGVRRSNSDEGGRREDRWLLEVVPQVRLGGKGAPSKLGQAVRVRLESPSRPGFSATPEINYDTYRGAFERVYWSVASEIYAQIGRGVKERIALLPPGRLRAVARLFEADDYATSNTLDAFEAARGLYQKTREWYDPAHRPLPATRWRKWVRHMRLELARAERWARRHISEVMRRAGRREVQAARAEIGYARILAVEWYLRLLEGTAPKNIFEAKPTVNRAIERLEGLPDDTVGLPEVMFRGQLALAMIRHFLRDPAGAKKALQEAECSQPAESSQDAEFLYVSGLMEPNRLVAIRLMRQATERDPTIEGAHFIGAAYCEEIWRRRPQLEPEVARVVDAEYRAVVEVNPGNIAAWANRGYISWLLAGSNNGQQPERVHGRSEWNWRKHARFVLETGRQYKEVRRETMVAELDWNLTRLAAEDGEFDRAYTHYIDTVSAQLGEPRLEFEEYFYKDMSGALLQRFEQYREMVETLAQDRGVENNRSVRSVLAFVYNDCGLAYKYHHERSGEVESLRLAEREFSKARKTNESFVLPTFNLAVLEFQLWGRESPAEDLDEHHAHLTAAEEHLEEVQRREPTWVRAKLVMAEVKAALASEFDKRRQQLPRDGDVPVENEEYALSGGQSYNPRAEEERLTGEWLACWEKLDEVLRGVLPHAFFRLDGSSRGNFDPTGRIVHDVVTNEAIRWERDFNEIHVRALILWNKALAADSRSAAAAFALSEKLRDTFYRGESSLLVSHRNAGQALLNGLVDEGDIDRKSELQRIVSDCNDLLRADIRIRLIKDPAHHELMDTGVLAWFDEDERRGVLKKALDELARWPNHTTCLAVGDAFVGLADQTEAAAVYAKVRGSKPLRATASLRRGDALASCGQVDGALEAHRSAARSGVASVAPTAARRAGQILEERGEGQEAMRLYQEAATSSPAVALALGGVLEGESKLREAAVAVYETVLDRPKPGHYTPEAAYRLGFVLEVGSSAAERAWRIVLETEDGSEREANARVNLALTLRGRASPNAEEIDSLLRSVAESRHDDPAAQASLQLARRLDDADPKRWSEIKALLTSALRRGAPTVIGEAAFLLGQGLEAHDQEEDARKTYTEAAGSSSQAALQLGTELREAGRPKLALEVCSTKASPGERDRLFAPDVHLLQAELLSELGKVDQAISACRKALDTPTAFAAPKAVVLLADLCRTERPELSIADVYAEILGGLDTVGVGPFAYRMGRELEGVDRQPDAETAYTTGAERDSLSALRIGDLLRDADPDDPLAKQIYSIGLTAGGLYVPDLQLRLGDMARMVDPDEAKRLYQQAIESDDFTVVPDAQRRLRDMERDRRPVALG